MEDLQRGRCRSLKLWCNDSERTPSLRTCFLSSAMLATPPLLLPPCKKLTCPSRNSSISRRPAVVDLATTPQQQRSRREERQVLDGMRQAVSSVSATKAEGMKAGGGVLSTEQAQMKKVLVQGSTFSGATNAAIARVLGVHPGYVAGVRANDRTRLVRRAANKNKPVSHTIPPPPLAALCTTHHPSHRARRVSA